MGYQRRVHGDGSKDQWNVHMDDIRVLEKGSEDYMIYWSLEVNETPLPKTKMLNKKKKQQSKSSEAPENVDTNSMGSESDEELEEVQVKKEINSSEGTEDSREMSSLDEVLDDLVNFMRAYDINDEEDNDEDRSTLSQEIERVFKVRSNSKFLSEMREFITYFSLQLASQPSSFPLLMDVPSLTKVKAIACISDLVLQKTLEEKAAEKLKIEL